MIATSKEKPGRPMRFTFKGWQPTPKTKEFGSPPDPDSQVGIRYVNEHAIHYDVARKMD